MQPESRRRRGARGGDGALPQIVKPALSARLIAILQEAHVRFMSGGL